jgi:hypothetical protein
MSQQVCIFNPTTKLIDLTQTLNTVGAITTWGSLAKSTVGVGVPGFINSISSTGNTAAIATASLLIGAAGSLTVGVYRVSYYHETSQAGSSSGSSTLTFSWNDGVASQSVNITTLTNTLGNIQQGSMIIRVPASQNISYAASYASTGGTVYKFDLYLTLEQIQ